MANEVSGVDILLALNTGTVESPVWTVIGGQRGATLSRTSEVADARHKSSGAWPNRVTTFLDWSVQGDAVYIQNDTTLEALRAAWRNRENVQVQVQHPNGIVETGFAVIADNSLSAPHTDVATVAINLQGNSPLVESGFHLGITVGFGGGNTGDGVFTSGPVADVNLQIGTYTLTCITEASNGGTFSVVAPDGTKLQNLTVAVAYDNNHFTGTLGDGTNDWDAGDTVTLTVASVAD